MWVHVVVLVSLYECLSAYHGCTTLCIMVSAVQVADDLGLLPTIVRPMHWW